MTISGSIVALVTPMHADGAIDYDALGALLDWHVASGTSAVVAVGTTGESATLNVREHCAVIESVVSTVAGRLPVIAGTGANSTSEAIELTEAAAGAGADACLLVTPYYNKPTQRGLYEHHKAVAEAVPIPQILYNVPGRTAVDMLTDTVERLADVPNIIGIKDATGDLRRGAELIARCGSQLAIYSGDDATAIELILMGAQGDISVTANIAPVQMAKACAAALAGSIDDDRGARALNELLVGLHRDLFVEASPIPVKWALSRMGRIGAGIRLPLTALDPDCYPVVEASMQKAGIFDA